ncbi:uncharacterized protein LOC134249453 [Saccostrea cucullata]|uniref:uncharacterized protein LOC134249453 n=1 Tax=Saccostrea cuccullata TaxID=36930 RepID=UPI002ED0B0E2
MASLISQIPKSSHLSQYIRDDKIFCTEFNLPLRDLETCLFNIASNQRWNENIPKEWSFFGIEINQKKILMRIMKISKIRSTASEITDRGEEVFKKVEKLDMLRYYHDAGKALYFKEDGLYDKVIINVQWFIDAFKHIITDKLHFTGIPGTQENWEEYYKTGNLRDQLLVEIWKYKDEELFEKLKKEEKYSDNESEDNDSEDESDENDKRYLLCHKESLLNFMQRLGLLAIGTESHYVPCMNRKEIETELLNLIEESESKSSVLVYQFDFLPFFLFFRLVVGCMQENGWKVLRNRGTSCLYKNAALFSYIQYNIVLSVTKESIQLQVFCPIQGIILETEKICLIQERIEELLNALAGTFNRKIQYVRGFRCRMDKEETIAMDIKEHFLPEKDIPKEDLKLMCPLHSVTDRHIIDTAELTRYWKL